MSKFKDKKVHANAVAAAKRKFSVWPSAYASGYVVQQYKRLYKAKHGSLSGAFRSDDLNKALKRLNKPSNDMSRLGKMLKDGSPKTKNVRARLAKIMDSYRKRNSY